MEYKEFGATIAPANKSDTGFPIAIGSHIGGGRTINGKNNLKLWQLLGDGADITEQKANAIGQIWYDRSDGKYYKLTGFTGDTPQWIEFLDIANINGTSNYIPKFTGAHNIGNSLIIDDGTTLKYGTNTIWHSGNDSSNSGLDADLLDGKHASYFATVTALTTEETARTNAYNTFSTNITDLTTALTALQNWKNAMTEADTDNVINTINEVLALFQNIPETTDIMALLNAKVNTADIVDNLTSVLTNVPLSANQGRVLKELITTLQSTSHSHTNFTALNATEEGFTTALKNKLANIEANANKNRVIKVNAANLGADSKPITFLGNIITTYNTASQEWTLDFGTNTGDETTQRIGSLINGATEKITPVDDDMVGLMDSDSASPNEMKKLSWKNIKVTLKAYFDALYATLGFYRVKVGSTYITSTTSSDTLEFIAGTNVTLTPDAGGKKLTIAASGGGGGGSSYREIKVNSTTILNNSNSSTINICNGVGTIVESGLIAGERAIYISAHMGNLEDPINGIDLQQPGMDTGIWAIVYGQHYYNTPNPICGTDVESVGLSGTYTHTRNVGGGTWTYHDLNTNEMYISSWYTDPVNGDTRNPWKRLLTCLDSTEHVIGEESVYDYVIDRNTTEINIDPAFDHKKDVINIDITAYKNIIGACINFKIIFNPAITGPVTVNIINGNPKPINYTQFYVDPASYSNTIFEIQYIIWNGSVHWLYHNRIL